MNAFKHNLFVSYHPRRMRRVILKCSIVEVIIEYLLLKKKKNSVRKEIVLAFILS